MSRIDKPFPFFLNNDRQNFWLICAISLFNYLFLLAFRPFGDDAATLFEQVLYSIICLVILTFNIILLPRIFCNWLDSSNWTFRKYFWFNIYNLVSISLIISVANILRGQLRDTDIQIGALLFFDLVHITLLGIIPLFVMTMMLKGRMLIQAVKSGKAATKHLDNSRRKGSKETEVGITIKSETKEALNLNVASFIYAQAQSNYTEIFWIEHDEIKSQLIRLTLKSLMEQLNNSALVRCHRSYVINLLQVESISGNANGYHLNMYNIENSIPVSRNLGKEVLEKINSMPIMAS